MKRLVLPAAVLAVSIACQPAPMTDQEANAAMRESFDGARGEAMVTEPIEISTSFTLGGALAAAAEELRAALQSQIPCSTVSVSNATVTVDFGTLEDTCTYNGHTYAGLWSIAIERTDESDVLVTHTWTGLTNGTISVDGTADVTWSATDRTRHVVHDFVVADTSGLREVTGEVTQGLVDESLGVAGGITVDGHRDWLVRPIESPEGTWSLAIDGVQMRGQDPVPQAGTYTLTNPDGKVLTLTFERLDEDSIQVSLTGTARPRTFVVSSTGQVEP